MNQFDEILKKRAREEPFPLPQDYAGRVLQTCAALEEPKPRKRYPFRQVTWAAAVLALMIVVPNVSPAAAAAMADVPVLGAIVRVITFRNYVYDDGFHSADISVPELGGDEAAQTVNKQVQDYTDRDKWLKMAIINTAKSGVFSTDRTIAEYNRFVWHLDKVIL